MIRLIYYEILKLIKRKNFWMILLTAILANMLLVNVSKTADDESGYKQYYYEQIYDKLDDMNIDDALLWLEKENEFYDIAQRYQLYLDFPDMFEEVDISEIDVNRFEKHRGDNYYWNERATIIDELKTYYESIKSYPSYLQSINKNLDKIMEGPLWSMISEKKKEDIIVQARTYDKLSKIEINPVSYRSIEKYAQSMISKLLSFVFICIIAVFIIKEDEENMHELLCSTLNGNKKIACAKIIAFVTVAFLSLLVINITDLIWHMMLYGTCDLQAYIQAIPSLYNSSALYTIVEWLGLSVLYFGVGICILGLVFMFLYHLFENKILSFIIYFTLFFIEAIFYVVIPEESIFVVLAQINILQYFNNLFVGTFVSYYHILSFRVVAQILLLCVLMIIGVCICASFTRLYDKKIKGKQIHFPNITIKSTNMFLQEGNRILQNNKGIAVLLLTVIIASSLFMLRYEKYETLRTEQREVYKMYEKYEGKVTVDTQNAVMSQLEIYAQSEAQYEKAKQLYKDEELTYEDLIEAENEYNSKIKDISTFNEINEMLQKEEQYIVYNKGFSAIFALKQVNRDTTRIILLILTLIIYISCISYKEGEETIYRTTYNGTKQRRNANLKHVCLGILFISIAIELFSFLHFYTLYPMHDFNVSMNYLLSLDGQLPISHLEEMNAGMYIIALYLIRLYGILSVGVISMCIVRVSKNRIIGLLINVAVFLLPMFLYYNGFSFMSYISIFDLLMGNLFLQYTFSFIKLLMIFVFDVICINVIFKSFKN